MSQLGRPDPSEYDLFYATYVDKVGDGEIRELLRAQREETLGLFGSVSPEKVEHRYAPGKWTLKEVFGHMIDTERIFSYRALCFARGDDAPLPGMDQDHFMAWSDFANRSLASFVEEYGHLRAANLVLFESFSDEVLMRKGEASGCPFTVRSMLYTLAGHELHHLGVLRERYL